MKRIIYLVLCFCFVNINAQTSRTIESVAGKLSKLLTQQELDSTMNLTITGTIDARDFLTMNNSMPLLAVLDLTEVKIVAYSGFEWSYADSCAANEIPPFAFNNPDTGDGKTQLTSISFPLTMTKIGENAFSNCENLKNIRINNSHYLLFPVSGFGSLNLSLCKLHVPNGFISLYKLKDGWNHFIIIEELQSNANTSLQ